MIAVTRSLRTSAALVLIACISACATPAGTPPPNVDAPAEFSEEYKIGVGDNLRIDVWRNPDLSVNVPVQARRHGVRAAGG